jgi:phosphoglycolate phosphatase
MQHIIFDLDGTISNPEIGILNGYKYTFPKVELPTPNDDELRTLIGPPLRIVFGEKYGLSTEQTDFAIDTYRVYYNTLGGAYENELYDGILPLIQALHQQHKKLHIATHKGAMAKEILKHFNIYSYFNQIQHYNEEKNIITKEKMIELIIEAENIADKDSVVMIGDRHSDIEAAHNTGVKSIGVTYGFGSKEEIIATKPTFIAHNVAELQAFLM